MPVVAMPSSKMSRYFLMIIEGNDNSTNVQCVSICRWDVMNPVSALSVVRFTQMRKRKVKCKNAKVKRVSAGNRAFLNYFTQRFEEDNDAKG